MNRNQVNGWAERFQLWVRRYALPIFFVCLTVGMTLILSFDLPGSNQINATVGQPALYDIFSPRTLTYTSQLLTRQAREQAGRAVNDVYTPLDLGIGQLATGPCAGRFRIYRDSARGFFSHSRAKTGIP